MKFFTLIFSLYIFSMCILPCGDSYSKNRSASSLTQAMENHNQQEGSNDFCSPFCICSCCSIVKNSTFQKVRAKEAESTPLDIRSLPNKNSHFISNYYGNIWPPPPKANI